VKVAEIEGFALAMKAPTPQFRGFSHEPEKLHQFYLYW